MQINASCKLDYNSVKALTHISLFKKANPKKRFIMWSVIFLVLAFIILLEMLIFSDITLIVLLCTVIVLFLFECYLYFILPKIKYNSLAKMKNAKNEYIFCDNILKVYTKSKEYSGEAEIDFSLFVKVYETSKYFFLYQTNNQVFVVDVSTVCGGKPEDIRIKLLSFVGDKYYICKY